MYYLHGDGMRRLGRPAPVQRSAAGSISPHLVRGAGLQDSTVVRTAQVKAFMAHFRAPGGGVAGACPSPDGSGSEASRIDLAAALREVEALNDEVEGGVRPPDGGLCPVAGREMRSYQGRTAARPFCLFQGPASPSRALARALASVSRAPQALPGPWGPPARPGPVSVPRALPLEVRVSKV